MMDVALYRFFSDFIIDLYQRFYLKKSTQADYFCFFVWEKRIAQDASSP